MGLDSQDRLRFPPSGEHGFTLLEGMMAAVVLAIGLLALAGMQGISLGRNVDANELTIASNLAADMVERIQFNRRNASIYDSIDTSNVSTQPVVSNVMANGDYAQWQARLTASPLKTPKGLVSVTATGPTSLNESQVIVTVSWQSSQASSSILRTRSVMLTTMIAPE